MLHNLHFIFHIMTFLAQLYLSLSNNTQVYHDPCTNISMSCTRPSSEAPSSQRILGGGTTMTTMTRKICQISPSLKSVHLMLLRAHTLTDCSLLGYLQGSHMYNAFVARYSKSDWSHLTAESQLAKMNCATRLSNNCC
jgi:hypothetical protein